MKKIFVETSVFIRFFTSDDENKYLDCLKVFELIEYGSIKPYTSNIVILEIIFILMRHYKFEKRKVLSAVKKLLSLRNLTLIETTNTKLSMTYFAKFNIKYGDCLIASQIPKGISLLTYDNDFSKVKAINVKTVKEIV